MSNEMDLKLLKLRGWVEREKEGEGYISEKKELNHFNL